MRKIVLIVHNIRSTYNVGSLLRTSEGLGISKVYLTGYTPHPIKPNEDRLPHAAAKQHKDISKTALGAENIVDWEYAQDINTVILRLTKSGFTICALEQTPDSLPINKYFASEKSALIIGSEVTGIPSDVLAKTTIRLEIPMFGKKESFNVASAAAMALYQLSFY